VITLNLASLKARVETAGSPPQAQKHTRNKMGMFKLQRPFQKDSVDNYEGVLVPLAQAKRHSLVIADYERRRSAESLRNSTRDTAALPDAKSGEVKDKDNDAGSGEDGMISTDSTAYSPYTIEGLKAEVLEDVAVSGHDSAYDCECSFFWKHEREGGVEMFC